MPITTEAQPADFSIRKRHPLIGAEIRGVDLRSPVDERTFAKIFDAWMENLLLVFPDQDISDAQQIAFARRFGGLELHPSADHRSSKHPEIYRVSNVDEQGRILPPAGSAWKYLELTWLWHTDSSFREIPSMGSILHGIEVPPEGGDTLFANMYAAYEALPAVRREELDDLRVVHTHDHILSLSKDSTLKDALNHDRQLSATHPIVRTHPVTGRKSLFISPHTMDRVEGWSEADSRALFQQLADFATQPEFVYRHKWRRNDVIMWDNRCTMHAVMPYDSANRRRVMHRTTIVGDGPVIAAANTAAAA